MTIDHYLSPEKIPRIDSVLSSSGLNFSISPFAIPYTIRCHLSETGEVVSLAFVYPGSVKPDFRERLDDKADPSITVGISLATESIAEILFSPNAGRSALMRAAARLSEAGGKTGRYARKFTYVMVSNLLTMYADNFTLAP